MKKLKVVIAVFICWATFGCNARHDGVHNTNDENVTPIESDSDLKIKKLTLLNEAAIYMNLYINNHSSTDSIKYEKLVSDALRKNFLVNELHNLNIIFYANAKNFERALAELDSVSSNFTKDIGGECFRELVRLRLLSMKAMATNSPNEAKNYTKRALEISKAYFNQNKSSINDELDSLGDHLQGNEKVCVNIMQHGTLLILNGELKEYDDFKTSILERHPNTHLLFSYSEGMADAYYNTYLGV